MTELILGPIVGGLSHSRAFLWGRTDTSAVLHAWVGKLPDLSDATLVGTSLPLRAEDGFAGVAPVQGLKPDTHYYYALTLTDRLPQPGVEPFASFQTFPRSGQRKSFSFAFGSCFRPADQNGGEIFNVIDAHRQADALRFILMIGDQVYADDYHKNSIQHVAETIEDFRSVYAYVWSRPAHRRMLRNLPAFMTLDDHEVDDDWRWTDSSRQLAYIPWWDSFQRLLEGRPRLERHISQQRVQNALQAYWEHQGMHTPPMEKPLEINSAGQYSLQSADPGSLAYTFTYGAAAFFVMDTRTMRVRGRKEASMLGAGQWRALESWLMAVKDAFPVKFLVSSCSLLFQMFVDIPRDRWSGFPKERERLLHFLAANDIRNVYVLTGDLHSAHAIRADLYGPDGRALPLWEFCASPFEQAPNWLARYTHVPIRGGPIRQQQCAWIVDQHNFGQVRVNFTDPVSPPAVRFELYGNQGDCLGSVDAG